MRFLCDVRAHMFMSMLYVNQEVKAGAAYVKSKPTVAPTCSLTRFGTVFARIHIQESQNENVLERPVNTMPWANSVHSSITLVWITRPRCCRCCCSKVACGHNPDYACCLRNDIKYYTGTEQDLNDKMELHRGLTKSWPCALACNQRQTDIDLGRGIWRWKR